MVDHVTDDPLGAMQWDVIALVPATVVDYVRDEEVALTQCGKLRGMLDDARGAGVEVNCGDDDETVLHGDSLCC